MPFSAYLFYKSASTTSDPRRPGDDWGEVLTPSSGRAGPADVDEYGFGSLKLKGGVFEPEEEIAAIRGAARGPSPARPCASTPTAAGSAHHAAARCRGSTGAGISGGSDPGIAGMAVVAERRLMPLATNMCVVAFDAFPAEPSRQGAVQVILSDHHYWGGLRATRGWPRSARTFGLGLSMHSNSHLGISLVAMTHVAAAIPNLTYACDTHYPVAGGGRDRRRPHCVPQRRVAVPDGPGLGSNSTGTRSPGCTSSIKRCGMRRRDDAGEMRKYRPDWVMRRPRF